MTAKMLGALSKILYNKKNMWKACGRDSHSAEIEFPIADCKVLPGTRSAALERLFYPKRNALKMEDRNFLDGPFSGRVV
jgi:hypothetical protein